MSEPFSKFISHEMPTNECRVTNQRFKIFISISFKVFIQPCITWCKWLINAQWNVFTWQSPGENSPSSDSIKCNWTLLHSFDICSSHVFLLTAAINLFESKLECCCFFIDLEYTDSDAVYNLIIVTDSLDKCSNVFIDFDSNWLNNCCWLFFGIIQTIDDK